MSNVCRTYNLVDDLWSQSFPVKSPLGVNQARRAVINALEDLEVELKLIKQTRAKRMICEFCSTVSEKADLEGWVSFLLQQQHGPNSAIHVTSMFYGKDSSYVRTPEGVYFKTKYGRGYKVRPNEIQLQVADQFFLETVSTEHLNKEVFKLQVSSLTIV